MGCESGWPADRDLGGQRNGRHTPILSRPPRRRDGRCVLGHERKKQWLLARFIPQRIVPRYNSPSSFSAPTPPMRATNKLHARSTLTPRSSRAKYGPCGAGVCSRETGFPRNADGEQYFVIFPAAQIGRSDDNPRLADSAFAAFYAPKKSTPFLAGPRENGEGV